MYDPLASGRGSVRRDPSRGVPGEPESSLAVKQPRGYLYKIRWDWLADEPERLCTGFAHRDGAWMPLHPDYWQFVNPNDDNKDVGRAISAECRSCANERQRSSDYYTELRGSDAAVNIGPYRALLAELFGRMGAAEAARRAHIPYTTVWHHCAGDRVRIRKSTIVALLRVLYEARENDEVIHVKDIRRGIGARGEQARHGRPTGLDDLFNSTSDQEQESDRIRKRELRGRAADDA